MSVEKIVDEWISPFQIDSMKIWSLCTMVVGVACVTPKLNVLPAIQEIEESVVTQIRSNSAIFRGFLKDERMIKNFLLSKVQISSTEFNQILHSFPFNTDIIRGTVKRLANPDKNDLALIQQFADQFAGSLQSTYRNAYDTLFDRMASHRDPRKLIEYLKITKELESNQFQTLLHHKSGNHKVIKLAAEKLKHPSIFDLNQLSLMAASYPPRTESYRFYETLETLLFRRLLGQQSRIGFLSAVKRMTGRIHRFNSDTYRVLLNRVLFMTPTTVTSMDDEVVKTILDASSKLSYPRLGDVKFVQGWSAHMVDLKRPAEFFALNRVVDRFTKTIGQREWRVLPCGDYCEYAGL